MTTTFAANTRLLLADEIMAVIVTTKGRWVKIQRADQEQGIVANISFTEAREAADRHAAWMAEQGFEANPTGDTAISWDEAEIEAFDNTTEAEIEEMLEEPVRPSMISTLLAPTLAPIAAPAPKFDGITCPKCGSTELYAGRNVEGRVVDEDKVIGCHHCDWEIAYSTSRRNGVVKAEYLDHYIRTTLVRDGDTIRSMDNNDPIAQALRAIDSLDEMYEYVAQQLQMDEVELRQKYGHLNSGMQRMNLGNRLRATARKAAQKA